ncbi:unnamed protein product [Schistosoma guineensis]|nr:unnamed protein product [Schistosoma guineensis]
MDVMSNTSNIISGKPGKPAISVSTYSGADNLRELNTQSVRRFRSYDELKKDFQKINVNVKTDPEIITEIMTEIKQDNSSDERLAILLEDLSYYLHQIDNAKIFSRNGFETLSRLLHHPSYEVKKASLKAISAATQGNSDVQVVALQNGVVDQLHSFLKASMDEQDSLEFTTLLSGGVSTLSALLRNFPVAQKQFFSTSVMSPSGFELLAKLSRLNVTNGIRGLRVRILTLLTDLYSERLDTQITFGEDPTKTKMDVWSIYASIPFEENFLMYGFCETLHISLLQDVQRGMGYNDLSAPVNHDIREKVITACLKFFNVCDWKSLNFSNKQYILSLLDSIIHEYELRSKSETDDIDSYFTEMLLKAQKFRNLLEPYESPKTDL